MTNEILRIGLSDSQTRWIGIRKHQAALALSGVLFSGDWLLRRNSSYAELAIGAILLVNSIPASDGLTIFEWLCEGVKFAVRGEWSRIELSTNDDFIEIKTSGISKFICCSLSHRGRLDLSGEDLALSDHLATFTNSLALSETTSHISQHVLCGKIANQAFLCIPSTSAIPSGWGKDNKLVHELVDFDSYFDVLERWRYVRTKNEVIHILRVTDFSQAPSNTSLLERLQVSNENIQLSVHYDVLTTQRSQKLSSRAVHRISSDNDLIQEAGFRRTAQANRSLDRLRQRELLVADGQPLLRSAVYISVKCSSLSELSLHVEKVIARANESGLRCQKGDGQQAKWFRYQLPGGSGW